jgi:hypothetical protein
MSLTLWRPSLGTLGTSTCNAAHQKPATTSFLLLYSDVTIYSNPMFIYLKFESRTLLYQGLRLWCSSPNERLLGSVLCIHLTCLPENACTLPCFSALTIGGSVRQSHRYMAGRHPLLLPFPRPSALAKQRSSASATSDKGTSERQSSGYCNAFQPSSRSLGFASSFSLRSFGLGHATITGLVIPSTPRRCSIRLRHLSVEKLHPSI